MLHREGEDEAAACIEAHPGITCSLCTTRNLLKGKEYISQTFYFDQVKVKVKYKPFHQVWSIYP